ncbi:MAG TPA: hypothetical protein PLW26_00080 [Candidatus Mcinerneyibacteriales bacterium]|nr:hypothetical protein [Candidatus Mcinerneyibacteriales bacterium]
MISIERTDAERFNVRIKVFGIGGGGCNALNNMVGSGLLKGLDFVAVNTDLQVLDQNKARHKLAIGSKLTRGLGAGGNPEIGEKAASEDRDKIRDMIDGASLLFLTTGMGGGTGTGATPVIASVAREMGILTIAVVTKPFEFEGKSRMENAKGDRGSKGVCRCCHRHPQSASFPPSGGKDLLPSGFPHGR